MRNRSPKDVPRYTEPKRWTDLGDLQFRLRAESRTNRYSSFEDRL